MHHAQSEKDEVPPGDKGEITAMLNIGTCIGTQVKTVTVETDEATNQKTVLTLKAEIPQQLEITPNFVFWKQGDKPDTKTINVKIQRFYGQTPKGHVFHSGFSSQSGGSW